jgi:hypothetical protein
MPASVHRTLADGMTILGLPGEIGNANTDLHSNVEVFFLSVAFCGDYVIMQTVVR